MVTIYRSSDGDVLDDICFHHYGQASAFTEVLKANPGLAEHGSVFPSGIQIILPDLAPSVNQESVSLWD